MTREKNINIVLFITGSIWWARVTKIKTKLVKWHIVISDHIFLNFLSLACTTRYQERKQTKVVSYRK